MTTTSFSPSPGLTVLGYQLVEPIGTGGYGEVWKAEAPGGIEKAIKFVFGVADGSRAQVELKALEKIKQVRHPFLLSLDRVEAVDGRLMIVTELASGSLSDMFLKYQHDGQAGIPRDELLRYMRDSADALDYLSSQHSLQHLDIKPENLLVVSGHVKVADFGLVKNIQNVTQSLMNGLTPSYAPPELFDGAPSAFSDQYSLAIVYQEMLTGMRPFSGTTPAQLAAQHMHGKPDLSSVPKGDQFVLQRALSKNPSNRFSSCLEMVEELLSRKQRAKPKPRRGVLAQSESENGTVLMDATKPDVTNRISSTNMPIKSAAVRRAPAVELAGESPAARPTLVLGVGKTGTNVARELRRLVNQRVGRREELPSLQFLCLDTDRKSLAQAICSLENDALDPAETMEITLASAQQFREQANRFSSWLGRRWIYNIPKSLQTEGLRPLGRLAFAHHAEAIGNRLQSSFEKMTAEENLAITAESLRFEPEMLPRVVVVGSISGGIGSGSVMDLAYAARTTLSDMGFQECQIDGMLMHSTAKIMGNRELNIANAFACLAELQHVAEFGYPGDESCGLPDFEDELPFENTYFLNFGDSLDPSRYAEKIGEVAEYLFHDIASPSQQFFDATRSQDDGFALRTFGIQHSGISSRSNLGEELTQGLIRRWVDRTEHSCEIERAADELAQQLEFDAGAEQTHWLAEAKKQLTEQHPQLIDQILDAGSTKPDQLLIMISQHVGAALDDIAGQPLTDWLEAEMDDRLEQQRLEVRQRLVDAINSPEIRIGGAWAILDRIRKRLTQVIDEYDSNVELIERYQSDTIEELQASFQKTRPGRELLSEFVTRLTSMIIHQQVIECCRNNKTRWKSTVAEIETEIGELSRNCQLIGRLSDGGGANPLDMIKQTVETRTTNICGLIAESITSRMPELVEQLDRWFDKSLGDKRKFTECLDDESMYYRELPEIIAALAGKLLGRELRKVNLDQLLLESGFSEKMFMGWVEKQVNNSEPKTNECGGEAHFLVSIPEHSETQLDADYLEEKFGFEPTIIRGTCGQLITCFEYRDIPLSNVAFRLLEDHPECFELVERIHGRTDVEWIKANQVFG